MNASCSSTLRSLISHAKLPVANEGTMLVGGLLFTVSAAALLDLKCDAQPLNEDGTRPFPRFVCEGPARTDAIAWSCIALVQLMAVVLAWCLNSTVRHLSEAQLQSLMCTHYRLFEAPNNVSFIGFIMLPMGLGMRIVNIADMGTAAGACVFFGLPGFIPAYNYFLTSRCSRCTAAESWLQRGPEGVRHHERRHEASVEEGRGGEAVTMGSVREPN